ncbi:sulfatase [Kiritimatiella glycovorans]|uniref:Choline-sulfatase n=1 Tax=Kiritimatiella glycovorans TaxID=1307763 RepID=A0A0G3ELW5_9BACT|nr:sulfatase [Kiritimatiella glycovorans]AKJ65154.1 Choline-sulfatase [Kiritimatiella glycovorans]
MRRNHGAETRLGRRDFLRMAAAGAGIAAAGPAAGLTAKAEGGRKNVLFLISDDLNTDIGCYGHPIVQTPNLDALARRGVRFHHAYCQFSVCNPSRASFLTGLRPETLGVVNNKDNFRDLNPDVVSLPQFFREQGYYTATIGKTFHVGEKDPKSWDFAAEWWLDELRSTKGPFDNPTRNHEHQLGWCLWKEVTEGDTYDDSILRHTLDQLDVCAQKEEPFFLACGFIRPHNPYFAPQRFFEPYPVEKLRLPEEPADADDPPAGAFPIGQWGQAYEQLTTVEKKELLRAYYACISYVDDSVGQVLDRLRELGLEEDTIVVFLGDHGYHCWEKDWWGKTTVFERSARSPLMIAYPGMPTAGRTCHRVVEFLDLYPTLARMAGFERPEGLEGRNLVPLLREPTMAWDEWSGAAYTQFGRNLWSVRTERWRYCEWTGREGGRALYDHKNDPEEHHNVVDHPEYAETVERLETMLAAKR